VLAYKKGSRVIQFKHDQDLPLPDWAQEAGTALGTWKEFRAVVNEGEYRVKGLPGVFAVGHIDEGTDMLLDHMNIEPGSSVLDLGCGYGILGMAAMRRGAGQVDFTDVSLPAAASTAATLQENDLPAGRVWARDVLEGVPPESYDQIITNPPFHAGHEVQYSMSEAIIQGAIRVLRPGGRLTLVANRFIRYDRLMMSAFRNVTDLAHTGKFHVLEAVRDKR
jgi:16S rRNA (guanine1207-N2)-methyltransferase